MTNAFLLSREAGLEKSCCTFTFTPEQWLKVTWHGDSKKNSSALCWASNPDDSMERRALYHSATNAANCSFRFGFRFDFYLSKYKHSTEVMFALMDPVAPCSIPKVFLKNFPAWKVDFTGLIDSIAWVKESIRLKYDGTHLALASGKSLKM